MLTNETKNRILNSVIYYKKIVYASKRNKNHTKVQQDI